MVITHSSGRAFRRCPRLYQYSYELRRRPINTPQALVFGDLTHKWLELYWRDESVTPHEIQELSDDPYVQAALAAMNSGYEQHWRGDHETWEVLAVEQEFSVPIEGGEYRGKYDGLIRERSTGDVYLLEHKTAGERTGLDAGEVYWTSLATDWQIALYAKAVRLTTPHEPVGVLYDVLRKPDEPYRATPEAQRRYTKAGVLYANCRDHDEDPDDYYARIRRDIAQAPGHYYRREFLPLIERDLHEAWEDMLATSEDIATGRRSRNPGACRDYNRLCDYHGVCAGRRSILDDDLYMTVEDEHGELKNGTIECGNRRHLATAPSTGVRAGEGW